MPKPPRKSLTSSTEFEVLDRSRRRCALCYHLKNDLTEKNGQIAHLDNDRTNNNEDNLAFLCLEHHSLYDSKTSQHKNYTTYEVRSAREGLYAAIEEEKHLSVSSVKAAGVEVDKKTLNALINVEYQTKGIDFLRSNNFAGFSFSWDSMDGLSYYVSECIGPEWEFLDPELEALRKLFLSKTNQFLTRLARTTFKDETGRASIPSDWETSQPERFSKVVDSTHQTAQEVCDAYDHLVRTSRRKLLS